MYADRSLWFVAAALFASLGCGGGSGATPGKPPSERSWSAPEVVQESGIAMLARAASDLKGNALVVWDDIEGNVTATRFDASKQTWLETEQLDPDNPDDSAIPDLAMNHDGNAVAVWQRQSQTDDTRSVWTNRYDAAKGMWGAATPIPNSELVLAPQVVIDAAGNALIAFTRAAIGASVMTARFDIERASWSAAAPIVPARGLLAGAPVLAMAPGGAAVAIWTDGDLENSAIWAAHYDLASESWQGAQAIGSRPGAAQPTALSINETGVATAVWVQSHEEKISVYSSRSEAKSGSWSEPERLDLEGNGDAFRPHIALDDAGNALVIWSAQAEEHRLVWTNRYDAEKRAWQGAKTLDAGDFDAYDATLTMEPTGHAVALWTHDEGSRVVPYTSSYDADERAWSVPRALEVETEARAGYTALARNPGGGALAVWWRDGKTMMASHLR